MEEAFINCPKCRWHGLNVKLCPKHKRFQQMVRGSKSECKTVPTYEELERLFAALVDMACPTCGQKMSMFMGSGLNKSRVLTLNHRHDGGFSLMCMACNLRHRHIPNDGFYERAAALKRKLAERASAGVKRIGRSGHGLHNPLRRANI